MANLRVWWGETGKQRAITWLNGNSVRVVLFVTGALLVLGAVFIVEKQQVLASTLTAAGTALMAFGALIPYIEGPFAFGPFRGRKATLPGTLVRGVPPTTGVKTTPLQRVDPVQTQPNEEVPTQPLEEVPTRPDDPVKQTNEEGNGG